MPQPPGTVLTDDPAAPTLEKAHHGQAALGADGYIADEDAKFDWAVPDKEAFFIDDLERPVGTTCRRRLEELMAVGETDPAAAAQSPAARAVAQIGPAADQVVSFPTLAAASPPGRGSSGTSPPSAPAPEGGSRA